MLKPSVLIGVLSLLACDGRPLAVGQPLNGSGNSVPTNAGPSGVAGPVCAALPASALCADNPTGSVAVRSMSALVAAMVGRWILCGHESVFAVDGGDVGIDITADHHWYRLYTAQGGATTRGAGFDEEGTWTSEDLGDHFQVNFDIFGSGTVITAPVFAAAPRAMRLNNNGVFVGNYVIDPTVPTGTVRCAAPPDLTRSGDCTPPSDALLDQACTEDVGLARTVGRWSRCGGSMPGAPLHDGIELTAEGTFYFLHNDPTAGLVRGTSDADTATAKVTSGPGCGDIFIDTRAGVSIGSSIKRYTSTPRQLWIYTGPEWGDPERYTFVSP